MSVIDELLKDVPLPKIVKVKQKFLRPKLENIKHEIRYQIKNKNVLSKIQKGQNVAITAGSRGIANLPLILKEIVYCIKEAGGDPFIVPAMGSHGGAKAEGQRAILEKMGITKSYIGAPIKATMEVVKIGETNTGLPVYIDKFANDADALIVVNRIKPHTSFRGKVESGLMKMITIGLGKQKGAEICHSLGFGRMAENILYIAREVIEKKNIIFGVGIVENAYDETAKIAVLQKDEFETKEAILLEESKKYMSKIHFDKFDVLVIDEIGKDISGTGMDTNIIGRYHTPYATGGPQITKMVVLDLTEKTHGNANGIGIVDFTTRRVFNKMSLEQTYPNSITSTVQESIKIPMILNNDKLAIAAAIKTCNIKDQTKVRLIRIKNTKYLDEIYISESLLKEASYNENIHVIGELETFHFDKNGNLL
ncbi:DUF2088 domain-containing protein [Crassaminicella thermophila]|uniref:DUF2088 domain-containing protein n=1 Tax=Crassaminicella thermophila TaxID=2599308 RepID=A0A5C0SFE6_CRATE|nr:lactate racemase domain-containing protein [Crassaminicella thermophila]QEK12910.1 DUF2088 domain-containing protein [Crassaminicella thermophila]